MSTNVINLSPEGQQAVTGALYNVIADAFSLYFKTHSYHWNVTGPNFFSLHNLFEEQYTEQWEALDEIAERIRSLDETAPISATALIQHSNISEASALTAETMVSDLAESNKQLVATLNDALAIASDLGDEVTVGMLGARLEVHEKNHWMLKSSI